MQDQHLERARLLYTQQRYELAAQSLRQALAESPHDAHAHALLALCLLRQDKYDAATDEARQAIHDAPDFAFAHYVLGAIDQERNLFAEAESAVREALRLDPENADYWALLSETFISRQRWKEALDAADHGLQGDAEHLGCTNLRAVALVKLGLKDEARFAIGNALQRDPHSAMSHANQGWTYLHQSDPKRALEHFREALRLDPNHGWAREGTLAALKARHLIYRVMLRYYLWMSKFNARGRWGIVAGMWVGAQILRAINRSNPQAAPYVYPLLIGYGVFAISSWLVDPIFNLTLMFSPFGRHLLTPVKQAGAAAVAALLLGGVGLVVAGIALPVEELILPGILMGFLSLPVAATANCKGRDLAVMGLYTLATAGAAVVACVMIFWNVAEALGVFELTLFACVLSSVAGSILLGIVRKK